MNDINPWENLSDVRVDSSSLENFKLSLDAFQKPTPSLEMD